MKISLQCLEANMEIIAVNSQGGGANLFHIISVT